jgi:hypothetical protein
MGVPHLFEEPVLFVGILFSEVRFFEDVLPALKAKFGRILLESEIQPWNFSDHYSEELGSPLYRKFIFFGEIIDPSILPDIKLYTNEIESSYSHSGKRRINLDPGYITLAKVVLASTKNYSHRIYLGKGIYAELALLYRGHQFHSMPYTYNDYKDPAYLNMFMTARNLLKKPKKKNS